MNCAQQIWVGAYVLDALEPEETARVQQHIAECPICQDEVVNLSWIPAMLRTVQLEDVQSLHEAATEDMSAPAPVLDRLLAASRSSRRMRRLRRPVAALVAVAAAATFAGAAVSTAEFAGTGGQPVAIRAEDPSSHVQAAVLLSQRSWGTEVRLRLSGVHPGQRCSLIAHARDGRTDVAATWSAGYRGTADVPGTTAIPLDQLREVDIVTSGGRQLARLVVPQGEHKEGETR
ncbi:MAG TPA: zf-HC2 domain-containing protein [Jatrophihabitans sp.]|jgi:hypothetical protein|nr:zf-HC2 domain-containing protein [Jatrophihabitans sp.]